MANKVYAVFVDWCLDDEPDFSTELFSNEEEALKQLYKEFESAKVDMNVEDNEDDEKSIIVEDDIATDKCFSIYEDGCYTLNHISGSIIEYKVKDRA